MKNTRKVQVAGPSEIRALSAPELARVVGGEGTPMPALWGRDGTPLPSGPVTRGTPLPA